MSQRPFVLESKNFFIKPSGLFLVVCGHDRVIQFDFHDAVPPPKRASSIVFADSRMVSSWQLNWWIAEVHRHLGQTRKLAEIGNSNRAVPFSGSLWERKTRVSARSESFRGKTLDRRDSLAERGEFELSGDFVNGQ